MLAWKSQVSFLADANKQDELRKFHSRRHTSVWNTGQRAYLAR